MLADIDTLSEASDTLKNLLCKLEMAEIDKKTFIEQHPQPDYSQRRRIDDLNLAINNARSFLASALERYYRDGTLAIVGLHGA